VAVYRLLVKASAAKEIEAVGSKDDRGRVVRRIQALAANPRGPGCEKLDRGEVTIFKVGHRKDIYR
jgi:mRNA-degrading endonuclease RelE of RelBE toxin-antitoxin system